MFSPKSTLAMATVTIFLAVSMLANAGQIVDHATKAEALLENGNAIEAVAELDAALEQAWSLAPLTFRKVLFVDQSTGYGLYVEREKPVFKPGEPLVIYAEPIGYGYGKTGAGGFEISLVVDFVLTDNAGKELYAQDDFIELTSPLRYHNREFHLDLTVDLSGLPEGLYIGKYLVRDRHSDKSAAFDLPFEVAK